MRLQKTLDAYHDDQSGINQSSPMFAEDEEQVDKLLGIADRAPRLRHIVYSNPRGIRKYADARLISADELARRGRDRSADEPDLYDRLVDATQGEAVAILCTTSGTTSHPKPYSSSGPLIE
jgi:long-chain acyl-CoA synthetase